MKAYLNHWKHNKTTRIILLILTVLLVIPVGRAQAEDTFPVSFGTVNYEELTINIYTGNNPITYYSIDKVNWTEVEGSYDNASKSYLMDISWIKETEDATLYLRGSKNQSIRQITLPAQNSSIKVIYDRANGEVSFDDVGEAVSFEWRKASDYHWKQVNLEESSASYMNFLTELDSLSAMGAKIAIRTPQIIGTGSNDPGMRPSKEVSISITKRPNAPNIRLNSNNMTLNTTDYMEYYDSATASWKDCNKAMTILQIAPQTLYTKGSRTVTLMIRTAQTASTPYSKTAYLTINGQSGAPVFGDNSADVTYYYMNGKLVLQFHKVTDVVKYEYTIVKSGAAYDAAKASWRVVSSNNLMSLTKVTAPEDSRIYVRKKGIDGTNSTPAELASVAAYFTVHYPG